MIPGFPNWLTITLLIFGLLAGFVLNAWARGRFK